MTQEKIQVKTFGGFSMTYCGKVLQLERNTATKASHLLQYLIYHWDRSFPKEDLVSILYSSDEVNDPVNNLKVNIFRLRKMLIAAGLPPQEYIVYQKGCYGWNPEIPVEIDAELFLKALDRAERPGPMEERLPDYNEALSLYKGEFLPILRGEEWASVIDVRCQSRYLDAVETVCRWYQEQGNPAMVMNTARDAAQNCPYEERVYLIQLRCLMGQQRYQEAVMLYDEVATLLMDEMGISPSAEMTAIYRQISAEENMAVTGLGEIRDYMRERNAMPGAYHCSYPAFIDSCRLLSRVVERSGQSAFLVLCTLKDGKETPLQPSNRLREAAAAMHCAIRSSLRKGDMYTRYSSSQFLLMLLGISRENCQIVTERIEKTFRQEPGARGVRVKWEYESATNVDMSGEGLRFSSGDMWE
ncbi:MAG: BTAD domain-containing putative transcriptional regulator [Oscillospiraceae bacterium]|nr:BTAD domain-containing putative transcriptional regulator [Oscillospiraceae bacterium]